MLKRMGVVLCVSALVATFVFLVRADDGEQGKGCKAGWHMCSCKTGGYPRKMCESEDLWKKCQTCWGDIAEHQCEKGKKDEVLKKACAEAKKADKLVLYIGNTGG